MRFSQRMGYSPIKTVLQIESIDEDLKNRLWNIIIEHFFNQLSESSLKTYEENPKGQMCLLIWKEMFGNTIDSIERYGNTDTVNTHAVIDFIRESFFKAPWYWIYDFIEFILPVADDDLAKEFNDAFQKEVAGYRIIKNQVIEITSEGEIAEIEEAISSSDQWKSVNIHLTAALDFLADRKNPDYRNSIKESISAVESLCLKIGGNANGKFGDALTEIERKIPLHGSLKRAFTALYGYTSDTGGIRHALIDDDVTPTFEDAKFMLVSCTAFINYLKVKMQL